MIEIAVCEDEEIYSDFLREYLTKYSEENHVIFDTAFFKNGDEILFSEKKFDIIFMDIKMPKTDGMTAARKLREKDPDFVLIFITSLSNMAVKGYEVDAMDFLVKPVSFFDFSVKLSNAIRQVGKRKKETILFIDKNRNVFNVDLKDILYFEVRSHTIMVHLKEKTIYLYGTLKETIKKVSEKDNKSFFLINKFYYINLNYVNEIEGNLVYIDHTPREVSRSKKKALVSALASYLRSFEE
jgi:DNA-binding LytR/AlgR family response regulator